jgi:hypothetical protein
LTTELTPDSREPRILPSLQRLWRGAMWLTLVAMVPFAEAQHPPWRATVASTETFRVGASTLLVDFAPGPLQLPTQQIANSVEQTAASVAEYYGKFPVTRARILIVPIAGQAGVLGGTTWGNVGGDPGFVRIRLGQNTSLDDLAKDWVITHELIHLALPSQERQQHWLEEGISTYVEPIIRARRGELSVPEVWREMVEGLPQGAPAVGRGLNATHTWASVYWGGALFCFLADLQIREHTHDRKSLQTALRAIVADGGSIDNSWPIERVLAVGDQATGTTVLHDLYAAIGDRGETVDLTAIWRELGVVDDGGTASFNPHARYAAIRAAMVAGPR